MHAWSPHGTYASDRGIDFDLADDARVWVLLHAHVPHVVVLRRHVRRRVGRRRRPVLVHHVVGVEHVGRRHVVRQRHVVRVRQRGHGGGLLLVVLLAVALLLLVAVLLPVAVLLAVALLLLAIAVLLPFAVLLAVAFLLGVAAVAAFLLGPVAAFLLGLLLLLLLLLGLLGRADGLDVGRPALAQLAHHVHRVHRADHRHLARRQVHGYGVDAWRNKQRGTEESRAVGVSQSVDWWSLTNGFIMGKKAEQCGLRTRWVRRAYRRARRRPSWPSACPCCHGAPASPRSSAAEQTRQHRQARVSLQSEAEEDIWMQVQSK
uniref:Uncharacterized protein n=1 Tax=Triticum urartu TaxID=4572 RepID=A0A8R7QLE6_TRIUA